MRNIIPHCWNVGYSYVGLMPNGRKRSFVSSEEYQEAFEEQLKEMKGEKD